jgi:phosphoribosylformimino-5-aminoimidazole carboxamide ribotide isomerase
MKIYPALDILNNQAVRLTKGLFETAKTYSTDPLAVALDFRQAGATHLHVIDLDGASQGTQKNLPTIIEICTQTDLKLQVGGGIRSIDSVENLIRNGVDRVIIGSLAALDKDLTVDIIKEFGANRITLALDCKDCDSDRPKVCYQGWRESSDLAIWDLLDQYRDLGALRILCTDIERDGTRQGSNQTFYKRLLDRYPKLNLQASGGIAQLTEIADLCDLGIESCVIGKSLYEGQFTMADLLTYEVSPC